MASFDCFSLGTENQLRLGTIIRTANDGLQKMSS